MEKHTTHFYYTNYSGESNNIATMQLPFVPMIGIEVDISGDINGDVKPENIALCNIKQHKITRVIYASNSFHINLPKSLDL